MSEDPFLLPGAPGKKTLADNLDRGALFETDDGVVYDYRGILPGGRWAMYTLDDEPMPLLMADPKTGFPQHPTHDQIIQSMALSKLSLVSSPLDEPVRNRARGEEKTRDEVLADDAYAEVRMAVSRRYDKDCREKKRPALDNDSLERWSVRCFDWETWEKKFRRPKPPASTLRTWIRKRGREGNRTWADMESRQGQGPRAKRVTGHRLAIAVWHATSHWVGRRHPTVAKLFKDVEADIRAFRDGKALIMHEGRRVWEKPGDEVKDVDHEFFRQLVKRLESRLSYKGRWNAQATKQRFEGGGSALEPTRYLEVIQQDETEVGAFFFIDCINRIPLGCATWVIAVDIFTRCVLAWDLSFDAPSTVSWMRNVLNASRWKALPKEYAERFPDLAKIGGRMSSIIYDNPSHLIGHAIEDAHGDLVQDVIFAGEGEPTHKGIVERTHETLRHLFAAKLPGAKMQIALAREFNLDASAETLLTLEEARLAMARAIAEYHTTKHTALQDRTPLDVWMEQWERWGPQHAKDQDQYSRAIGNVTFTRALDNNGVVNEYLEYSEVDVTPELMESYALKSHIRRNAKKPTFDAKMKWDPTDISQVYILDPVTGRYRRLRAKKLRYTAGLTLALHKLVLRYRGAQSLLADPKGEEKLLEIRRLAETELKRISPKMEASEKRARAAIMQQPAFRELAGDAIHLIDVRPSPTGKEVTHDVAFNRDDAFQTPIRGKRGGAKNNANDTPSEDEEVKLPIPAPFAEPTPVSPADQSPDGGDAAPQSDTGAPDGEGPDDDDGDVIGSFEKY